MLDLEKFYRDLAKAGFLNRLDQWRELSKSLAQFKIANFPKGAVVYVDCDRYRGYGIVSMWDGCPMDHLAVYLENGNTWFYPLEKCERVRVLRNLPKEVRRMKLKFHGYKLLSTCPFGIGKERL